MSSGSVSQESDSKESHEQSSFRLQQSGEVRNEFRNKLAHGIKLFNRYLTLSEAAHFSVVSSPKPNPKPENNIKRETINCSLDLDYTIDSKFPSQWLSFLSSFSSQRQTVKDICDNGVVPIKNSNAMYSQYCLEKYFERHKRSEIRVLCVRILSPTYPEANVFCNTIRGISLIKSYLSNVKNLLIIIKERVYFNFYLHDTDASLLIEDILKEFEKLAISDKIIWEFEKVARYFLDTIQVAKYELKEILVSVQFYPECHGFYNALEENKKNKIIWCLFPGNNFYCNEYPQLESLCIAYHLDATQYRLLSCYDFSVNPIIQDIVLKVSSPALEFRLPGEMDHSDMDSDKIVRDVAETAFPFPHPLRHLCIEHTLKSDFNLQRISKGRFSNLVHLTLEVNKVTGVLQGKLLTSLNELRVSRLHEDAILDFSDVEEPLSILRLEDCSGRVLMKACPATFEVVGPFNVNDENTFFANVRNLSIKILKEKDIKQWQHLIGLKFEDFENADNKYPGKMVEVLAIHHSSANMANYFIQKNNVLKELSCSKIRTVIDGSRLPQLKSLTLDDCTCNLMSTFTNLEKISWKTWLVYGAWVIKIQNLRSIKWCSNLGGTKVEVDNVAIRGSENEVITRQIQSHFSPVPVQKNIVLPFFEELELNLNVSSSSIVNIIQYANISNLTLTMPVDLWFKLPKHELQCEIACFKILKDTRVMLNPSFQAGDLPSMPKVRELTVTSIQYVIHLNTNMPNLEYLNVGTNVKYGEKLRCPKIKFVEATSEATFFDEMQVKHEFQTQIFGQDILGNVSPQTRWLLISRNREVIKIDPPSCAQKSSAKLAEPSSSSPASHASTVSSSGDVTSIVASKELPPGDQFPSEFVGSRENWCECCFSMP